MPGTGLLPRRAFMARAVRAGTKARIDLLQPLQLCRFQRPAQRGRCREQRAGLLGAGQRMLRHALGGQRPGLIGRGSPPSARASGAGGSRKTINAWL